MNFATADRPRCMQRCEFYPHQYQLQQKRRYRKFDFYGDDEEFEEPTWYYNNMNHQGTHSNGVKAKSSCNNNNNNYRSSASNASNRSSTSGFQSFFRWFRKDDKSHAKDIRYPRDLTSSTDTLEFDHDRRLERVQNRKKLRSYNSTDTITPPSSPRNSRTFSQSSSCDSVFSTASSFAFVPPIKYLLNRNQKQVERTILDNPYTESYHKRVKARDRVREIDRNNEVTLRKKYHLYTESSDVETNNNNKNNHSRNKSNNNQNKYQDLSLPSNRRIIEESNNLPDSAKLKDLNAVTKLHRRTSSDTSKDKKAGAFVHVKHKRKAPPPPLDLNSNTKSLDQKSTTGRKKRQAPLPPKSPTTKVLEEASSATSLLGDKEIQAIIHGGIPSLVKNPTSASTPAVSVSRESPKMEPKRQYVSPYLKIREDRKLTDEQKRMLLEQVSKTHQKSTDQISRQSTNQLTIENGQLVYQRAESPKVTKNDKDKVFAPSSPISPRPWYKRNNANNNQKETIPFKKEVFLKTMEKRKKKDEKDLPEVGYSRNSFFESASKFNIFARLGEDSKKKEKDAEKRRSQIGIPNISELDREAAEIIQRGQQIEVTKPDINHSTLNGEIKEVEEPVNTRELIHKFEITSSHITRITVNGDFAGREDLFGKNGNVKIEKMSPKLQLKKREESPSKTKLPVAINGSKKSSSLMGLWNCPYCTLENPNWKIICEACGKIKPYEKRFVPNETSNIPKMSPTSPRKYSFENNNTDYNPWDKKTELVKKYFHPQNKFNELAKSSSETFIANSMLKKSPSPTRRFMGSPKMLPRKISVDKSEPKSPKIESIVEESSESDKHQEKEVNKKLNSVIVATSKTIFPSIDNDTKSKDEKQIEDVNLRKTPDLDEIRSARLAKFHTSLEIKKNQSEVERMNVTVNRKQSPEKKFPDKLDFSDPIALEREKERLRDKIRAMNAKALTEKYPVLKKTINEEQSKPENMIEEAAPQPLTDNTTEGSKLGAIKKVLKKPLETHQENFENQAIALEEKIINKDSKPPEVPKIEKREKISISVQTNPEVKARKKSEDSLPTTVTEICKRTENENEVKTIKTQPAPIINGFPESNKEAESKMPEKTIIKIEPTVDEVKEKSPIYTNTIAINKILRHLEHAISEGRHDDAAQLAKDLARMKVPLHVTRQKKRPKSSSDLEVTKLSAYLYIKEDYREMEVNCYEISPFMTIGDLKLQISKDYYIPIEKQVLSINNVEVLNDKTALNDLGMQLDKNLKIKVNASRNQKNSKKEDSESDDELQNEKIGKLDEAVGGLVDVNKPAETKNNIEDKGWECPLCTLINLPNRQQCLACSTSRPKDNKNTKLMELEYHLKVNEDLRTFFEMDKVDLRPKHVEKNDLNRQSVNRKSSDLLNIFVEDKNLFKKELIPQHQPNTIVLTAAISNPNITRNKYRGVDNFNPYKSYFFPKTEVTSNQIRKPIITNVIYKSSQNVTKEIPKKNRSHYQELVSLEISDTVPNVEKFECAICFLEIEPKAGVCLRECLHTFCKLCLEHHIKYSDEAEIKCPYIDDTFSCQCLLQEREIRGLVSKDEYEKHLSRSIRLAENSMENTYHCKTPNCKGWCIFEENLNTFKCPVCTIVNCITCGAIHDGLNCKQYQDHLVRDTDNESINQTKKLLQELIEKDEAMNCPTCHIFLLKKWGCDWLKCTFCKTEICWVTKQTRWGPGGKGDISGGCKCGVNGKKCSPKCTYCH